MCFKKPKLPELSPEEKAEQERVDRELEAARILREREANALITENKDAQTEIAYARALGQIGNRSLITGPKGGQGYMGAGAGRAAAIASAPKVTKPVTPKPSFIAPNTGPQQVNIPLNFAQAFAGYGGSLIGTGSRYGGY